MELQRRITEWAEDKTGKPIFWLKGMAGTGKSTIARTAAQLMTCPKHDRKVFTGLKDYSVRRGVRKNLKQYSRRGGCR